LATENEPGSNFLRAIIEEDLRTGKNTTVVTRFPPEPNGYLHIGHAKAICVNFALAEAYDGRCHLRFDDTNPEKEEQEYIDAIQRDVRWLGFDWGGHLFHGSDFFEEMYDLAEGLVREGKAYVDSQTEDEIRATRGTVTEPGTESPYRDRSMEENLNLLRRMRAGEFPDGAHVLRARIDMAAENMKMRDPLLYRIRHASHPHRGDAWCIYPFYDYAHPLEDAFEGITHSFCTLEFENNRELYDWVLDNVPREWHPRPYQYEFARLFLGYTVMSKRKLLQLVQEGRVSGWDDPRMPTLAGLRRRGVTPEAIRAFSDRIGVAKANSMVDLAALEACIRDDLNLRAPRAMAVLDPLRVVIENYPEGKAEAFEVPSWPPDVSRQGSRPVPFSRVLYIERDDFMEHPPKRFFRLAPGREVRLRSAYLITCIEVVKDHRGEVVELRCTYDPASRGGSAPDGRKVKGTLHWVSAAHAVDAEVRLYDRLFTVEDPDAGGVDFHEHLNPHSLEVVTAKLEPGLAGADPGSHYQFERRGYFFVDPVDSVEGRPVFNQVVPLKDSWAKIAEATAERAPRPSGPEEPTATESRPTPAGKPERPPRDATEEARFRLYVEDRGISADAADLIARSADLANLFAEALAAHPNAQGIANWIVNDRLPSSPSAARSSASSSRSSTPGASRPASPRTSSRRCSQPEPTLTRW
jgi:glutaminyl-tRNA synthetase